jgi:hypothetical protein
MSGVLLCQEEKIWQIPSKLKIMLQLQRPELRYELKRSSKPLHGSEKRKRGSTWRNKKTQGEKLEGNLWLTGECRLRLKLPCIPGMW